MSRRRRNWTLQLVKIATQRQHWSYQLTHHISRVDLIGEAILALLKEVLLQSTLSVLTCITPSCSFREEKHDLPSWFFWMDFSLRPARHRVDSPGKERPALVIVQLIHRTVSGGTAKKQLDIGGINTGCLESEPAGGPPAPS